MSVEVDDIEFMRRALTSFRLWEVGLKKLNTDEFDKTAKTALDVSLGAINKTCCWLHNCILWENEARKKGGEK